MSFPETIRVVQPGMRRIKVFVDFWNVVINARKICKDFEIEINWDLLCQVIINSSGHGVGDETTGSLAGCYIFGSVSRSNASESKFVDGVIDNYGSNNGLFFIFSERVSKITSIKCSECGGVVKTRSESGVDVLLTVEMIKHSFMKEHEYIALVSSDRDFIPLVSFLKDQGQRVLHVSTGASNRDLRSLTWGQLALTPIYPRVCSIKHDDYIVLSTPFCSKEVQEILKYSNVNGDNIRIFDLSDPFSMKDEDFEFIIENQSIYWKLSGGGGNHMFHHKSASVSVDAFRKKIKSGELYGNFPYIIHRGACFAYHNADNGRYRWIRMANRMAEYSGWDRLFEIRGE